MYKLIKVSGRDTTIFLQGQLTLDVETLDDSYSNLAAWCNAKGRVISIVRLTRLENGIGLLVPESLADQIMQRLTMYRLRSDVSFEAGDNRVDDLDPNIADLKSLILSGVATIDITNTESYTPHMLNLDKLGAISFTKGCYTGQEVVARTEHLGKSKRRLMRYQASEKGLSAGDKVSFEGRNVGEIVNVSERDLLAVTPVELHDQVLSVGDLTIQPLELPYDI